MEKTRFMHIGNKGNAQHKGVVTLAYRSGEYRTEFIMGAAFCSPDDNFCKATARQIAEGRMNCQRTRMRCFVGEQRSVGEQIFEAFVRSAYRRHIPHQPQWLRHLLHEEFLILALMDQSLGNVI